MKRSHSLLCAIVVAVLALWTWNANSEVISQDTVGEWCVANAKAGENQLKEFIEEACKGGSSRSSVLDCTAISPAGSCFQPNTTRDHASYVLNLYYKSRGYCNLDIGIIVTKDPSTKSCTYPGTQ